MAIAFYQTKVDHANTHRVCTDAQVCGHKYSAAVYKMHTIYFEIGTQHAACMLNIVEIIYHVIVNIRYDRNAPVNLIEMHSCVSSPEFVPNISRWLRREKTPKNAHAKMELVDRPPSASGMAAATLSGRQIVHVLRARYIFG